MKEVFDMRRLVSTIDLPKTDWLKYRKKGITGTDAGAICGLNPYSSAFQIYQDKITDEIEEFDNESMRQGRDLEEYVARRFSEETGLKVRRANAIFQNEENPFMLADFDRLIVGQKAGLECKNGMTAIYHYIIRCRFSIILQSAVLIVGILLLWFLEESF